RRTPGPVELRLRARRELRPFHADVGPAVVDPRAFGAGRLAEHVGERGAHGVAELDVRDDAVAEESRITAEGAVDELVGDDDVAGGDLLAQAADRADREEE